jgi:hypothetical protein
MMLLNADPEDPYVPFVTSHRSKAPIHEIRRLERNVSPPRRAIGRALVRAGLAVAGRAGSSR